MLSCVPMGIRIVSVKLWMKQRQSSVGAYGMLSCVPMGINIVNLKLWPKQRQTNQNDGSGVVYRMVDGLRYHHLKMAILAIDTCTQGLPLIEFTAYGKSAISMKCIKCKASLSRSFINDGVNFDLEGTPSNAYGAGHHGLTFD